MMQKTSTKKEEPAGRDLIDLVFSWNIKDVLNEDLYKDQIKKIPDTFKSTTDYMKSFIPPLIKETQIDLLSSMTALSRAPTCEILSVKKLKNYEPPKDLFYNISLKRMRNTDNDVEKYEPEVGDLIALTDVRPKCIEHLSRPERSYIVAIVQRRTEFSDKLDILASKPIIVEKDIQKSSERETLFAVYLINMTTYIRVWQALNSELKGGNMNVIKKVLQANSADEENCAHCFDKVNGSITFSNIKAMIHSFHLNDSQETAILSCIATSKCHHQNTVKLIWGPPGTGKTTTVGLLLFALLKMKCRTLTCAPTNIAVLQVTKRLMKLVMESLEYDTYGLGDIVLFGNGERMKIDEHDDLLDVFLDNRVEILSKCFAEWKNSLESVICLLENPEEQYRLYLREYEQNRKDEKSKKISQKHQASKKSKNKEDKMSPSVKEKQSKYEKKEDKKGVSKNQKNKREAVQKCDLLTFEEIVKKRFNLIGDPLKFCIVDLYKHLPTSIISLEVAKNMIRVVGLLRSPESLFHDVSVANKGLEQVLHVRICQEHIHEYRTPN